MRRALALGVPLALLSAACTYDNGDANRALYTQSAPSCGAPAQSKINVDAQLAIDAGVGAGVFIEYASGGHYHVQTACDTTESNTSCNWDVIVSPEDGHMITNVVGENLEANDSLLPFPIPTGSYELNALTTTQIDGFTFDTDPGASILVDAQLDGQCADRYFFWVGDGALHPGAPSSQLTLIPSAD